MAQWLRIGWNLNVNLNANWNLKLNVNVNVDVDVDVIVVTRVWMLLAGLVRTVYEYCIAKSYFFVVAELECSSWSALNWMVFFWTALNRWCSWTAWDTHLHPFLSSIWLTYDITSSSQHTHHHITSHHTTTESSLPGMVTSICMSIAYTILPCVMHATLSFSLCICLCVTS